MKRILLLVFWCSVSLWADAQALLGTTGLLHAPTADMQRDKTFLFGGNYLNTHPLSTHFRISEVGYTFNYYINITIFPWLEVSYICTLVHADHGSTYFPEQSWGKFTNQDRAFSARLRLWKEGWWKEWTPQIVLGLDDPTSHADHGGGGLVSGNTSGSNNYATRYYLAGIPPACAPQDTLVRVALMATHTKEQVDYAVDKLTKCFKKLEIIK